MPFASYRKLREYQNEYARTVGFDQRRDKKLQKRYGINLEDYNNMLSEQNGEVK